MTDVEADRGVWGDLHRSLSRAGEPSDAPGVWKDLERSLDPGEWRPKLADDIEIADFVTRWGTNYTMIGNPRDLAHYRLEPQQVAILRLLDGSRTVREIVVDHLRQSGEMDMVEVGALLRELEASNFFERRYVDVDGAVRRGLDPAGAGARAGRQFVKTLRYDWAGADRIVQWFYRNGCNVFFRPPVAILSALLSLVGVVCFFILVAQGRYTLTGGSVALGLIVLLILDYFMTFVHELGHALVLAHSRRHIKSAGFLIYFGAPAFFVDSSDSLMMGKNKEIQSSFAGPYAQMIVGAAACVVALAFPTWFLSETMYRFAVLNYFTVFMNLIPLLELDGYFILSDWLEMPDLRPRSLEFVQRDMWRKLRVRERFSRPEIGYMLYGIVGVVFTLFCFYTAYFYWRAVFGGLISKLWNGGSVLRVLLFVLAAVVAGPLVRGAISWVKALLRRVRLEWRRVKFRLETRWRVEAARLIDALPLFEDVPEEVLNDLAGRVELHSYPAGQSVVRQGDRATAFYVVRRGRVRVVERNEETGAERTLRVLGPGESFGELALIQGAKRSATVRAIEETEVFEVGKGTFDRLLADMASVPRFAPTLQAAAELRELPCFAAMGTDELADVLAKGRWQNIVSGETIIREGDAGDAFYVLGSGKVNVLRDGELVRTMGPGSFFGELALLLDAPRTATVTAVTPARAFRLDREAFDLLVGRLFRRGALDPAVSLDEVWQH